jgi:SET domain-containing protein
MTSELRQPSSFYSLSEQRTSATVIYSNETFYVEECDVGLGVFANRAIRKGEIILAFGGPIIGFEETKRRGRWECMPLQIGPIQYYDTRPPGIFVNHSCDPNAGIKNDRDLVARREISKEEEFRFDYSTTMQEQSFTMRCLCGTPKCRQVVADFSTLPQATRERYIAEGIVMSFIAQHLRR